MEDVAGIACVNVGPLSGAAPEASAGFVRFAPTGGRCRSRSCALVTRAVRRRPGGKRRLRRGVAPRCTLREPVVYTRGPRSPASPRRQAPASRSCPAPPAHVAGAGRACSGSARPGVAPEASADLAKLSHSTGARARNSRLRRSDRAGAFCAPTRCWPAKASRATPDREPLLCRFLTARVYARCADDSPVCDSVSSLTLDVPR